MKPEMFKFILQLGGMLWAPPLVGIALRVIEHVHLWAAFCVTLLLWVTAAVYFCAGFNKAQKESFDELEVLRRENDFRSEKIAELCTTVQILRQIGNGSVRAEPVECNDLVEELCVPRARQSAQVVSFHRRTC